ncbi:MAG: hypothetical protein JO363_18495 [Solirubrobacterales bacterium]|nr:hypothetical protein [Solirubrobacterales bacterium]
MLAAAELVIRILVWAPSSVRAASKALPHTRAAAETAVFADVVVVVAVDGEEPPHPATAAPPQHSARARR